VEMLTVFCVCDSVVSTQ